MKTLSLMALLAITAVSCVTASGPRYERASSANDFGYYDTRLDDNRYRVQYRADGSDYGVAQDFAMRRSAQLTLDRGYQWFQVVGRSRAVSDDMFGRYDSSRYAAPESNRDRPPYGSDYRDDVVVLEIVMGYNPPPRGSSIYDPRRVLDNRYDNDRRY